MVLPDWAYGELLKLLPLGLGWIVMVWVVVRYWVKAKGVKDGDGR